MTDTVETIVDGSGLATAPRAKERRGHIRYIAYVLTLIGIPALFLVSAIPIVRTQSFPSDSADPFLLNLNYSDSLKQANCAVLIFGDSTAETGIDPTVIAHRTGLKTCNIAEAQSIIELAGMTALSTYLSSNAAPKFIIFQFSPETLARDYRSFFWPEGLTELFRQRSLADGLLIIITHPVKFYQFAIWAIKSKLTAQFHAPPIFAATELEFHAHFGLLTLPKPPESHCIAKTLFYRPTKSWVDGLRKRYSTDHTRVFINVSPVPRCENDVGAIAAAMRGVTDNALPVLPIDQFNDLDRHLTLQGADYLSLVIARQIEDAEESLAAVPQSSIGSRH